MKNRNIILLSFLLFLYIAPSFLAMTSYSLPIPAQQNTTKEFSISDGWLWFDESFHYRKSALIDAGSPTGPNYQIKIPVSYNAHMQSDFDDIRFTDNSGGLLLNYWRESYVASTSAVFWVKISEELDGNLTIYMYYGNSTVSTTSNGTATFLFYEDWTSESVRSDVWDVKDSAGTVSFSPTGATHGTIATIGGTAGTGVYRIESDLYKSGPIATRFRSTLQKTTTTSQRVLQGMGTAWDIAVVVSAIYSDAGTHTFLNKDDDQNVDQQPMAVGDFDNYFIYDITRDGTNGRLYKDGSLIETASLQPDTLSSPASVIYVRDSEYDCLSDWIVVRKFVSPEPTFDSFGSEETNIPPPEWHEVGEAILIFSIPIDETALNWFLILLGMFMVPASTLYLVKGGKKDASMDKVFYFIVAFLFGWGLIFIGVS